MNLLAKVKQDAIRWDTAALFSAAVGGFLGAMAYDLLSRLLS
ncbi:hypothetical protein [Stenotrophomonas sp. PS02297]|nr:hypothetical protein [Stenotrophomonas sp. PS02297]